MLAFRFLRRGLDGLVEEVQRRARFVQRLLRDRLDVLLLRGLRERLDRVREVDAA